LTRLRRPGAAVLASAAGIAGIVATAGLSLFPFLMPSDIMPAASLTVWDASSSRLTLFVMLLATLLFLPLILIYTAVAFRAMRGMVSASQIERDSSSHY
jgi:cytochrome d ubiquinol oxidase subunit II